MIARLAKNQNWAKAAPWLGIAAAVLLFVFWNPAQPAFWALVNIPLYFFHQTEEHYVPGGFKRYVNEKVNRLPEGEEALTDRKVFWINIILVWVAFLVFGALSFLSLGFGLLIIIFSVINCLTHIATAARRREYNPGLAVASLQLAVSVYAAYFLSAFGNIEGLALWWAGTVVFSAAAHIAVFRAGMRKSQTRSNVR